MIFRRWEDLGAQRCIIDEDVGFVSENKPTMPILRLLLGRPRRVFFSGAPAFLGGILFFAVQGRDVEKKAARTDG